MGLQINTNVSALNAYRNLSSTQSSMATSLERLSSGLRINRAADDAAGLAISEKLGAQVNGLNQAQANAQDGISLVQTAEGALNETQSILQRMRTLAVQSASDTNTVSDRAEIQKEITSLSTEIGDIASNTEFNGKKLLNSSTTSLTLQVGANSGQTMTIAVGDMTAVGLGISTVSLATQTGAAAALTTLDAALQSVSDQRSQLGAYQNSLQHTVSNLGVSAENMTAAQSRIRDTDMAKEMTSFSRSQILQSAGVSMLSQANQAPQSVLKLLG